jgi:hypothetical protein
MGWALRLTVLSVVMSAHLIAQPAASPPATTGNYKPLDPTARWRQYLDDTWLSEWFYIGAVATAGYDQLHGTPEEWGGGMSGFGKRTASWVGVFGIQESLHHGGAAALGYDPRYLVCKCRGFFRRFGHAIEWSFVTKNSSGQVRPDFPVVAGAYGSVMIAGAWYPAPYRPLAPEVIRAGNEQMIFVVGFNLLTEFTPEIKKALRFGH